MSVYKLVHEFHNKYGLPISSDDRQLLDTGDKQMFDAHTHMLKELCDLVYVAVGTSVSFGYSFDDGFKSVHTSNMTKDGNINSNGKITKGPSYKGPEELGMYINGRV